MTIRDQILFFVTAQISYKQIYITICPKKFCPSQGDEDDDDDDCTYPFAGRAGATVIEQIVIERYHIYCIVCTYIHCTIHNLSGGETLGFGTASPSFF